REKAALKTDDNSKLRAMTPRKNDTKIGIRLMDTPVALFVDASQGLAAALRHNAVGGDVMQQFNLDLGDAQVAFGELDAILPGSTAAGKVASYEFIKGGAELPENVARLKK